MSFDALLMYTDKIAMHHALVSVPFLDVDWLAVANHTVLS
jgi:hypothetical protein